MFDRRFYHAFPRRRDVDPLTILASMIDSGFLLVPEMVSWQNFLSRNFGREGLGRFQTWTLQVRFCPTELMPPDSDDREKTFEHHASRFGAFAIEFDSEKLRQLGALPVLYLPRQRAMGSADDVGLRVLSHLTTLKTFLLEGRSGPPTSLGRRLIEEMTREHPACANIRLESIRRVIGQFYPTERGLDDEDLSYFRQREWRVMSDLMPDGACRPLTNQEARNLHNIDHRFFADNGWTLDDPRFARPRTSYCLFVEHIEGERVFSFVRRVVCPMDSVTRVKELVRRRGYATPVHGYDHTLVDQIAQVRRLLDADVSGQSVHAALYSIVNERAGRLWVEDGARHGRPDSYWFHARKQLGVPIDVFV